MRQHVLAAVFLLALAACKAEEDPAVMAMTAENAAEQAEPSGNPALGRWIAQSGSCSDLSDVRFTATEVLAFSEGGGARGIPVTYSDLGGNSVMIVSGDGKQVVVTRTDADHLALSTPDGQKGCVLVRR